MCMSYSFLYMSDCMRISITNVCDGAYMHAYVDSEFDTSL